MVLGLDLDPERLSAYLRVLAVPNRLLLLQKLQVPHAVAEIELKPFRRDKGQNPDRPISRQAVEEHLAVLEAAGLVETREAERGSRRVTEYVVNHARLFTLIEEMRQLSLIRPAPGVFSQETQAGRSARVVAGPAKALPPGPALVLVGGPLDGRAFELLGDGPWTLGRDKDSSAALTYDPFVSGKNSRIRLTKGRFTIEDDGSSKNGTRVNWRPLAPGESAPLENGDVVGVGRSLLVFRGA